MSKLTEIVKGKVTQVDSIAGLYGLVGFEGMQVSVTGYHVGTTVGGGVFVHGIGRHDGGTAISLSRTFPTNWDDQTQLTAWFADSGIDELCFVRTSVSYENKAFLFGLKDLSDRDLFLVSGELGTTHLTRASSFPDILNTSIYALDGKVYYTESPFDLVDVEKNFAVSQFFVDYENGDDSNTGLGADSSRAWKTLTYALNNAGTRSVINILNDYVGYLSYSGVGGLDLGSQELKIRGVSVKPTVIGSFRESYTQAGFSWVDSGGGAWESTTTQAKLYAAQFDRKFADEDGFPLPVTEASSAAACKQLPSSYFWDGVSKLIVHLKDGRKPDPIAEGGDWIFTETPYRADFNSDGGTLIFENLDFVSNTSSGTATFRYRPVTVDGVTENTGSILGLKKCRSYGSDGNGFEIYDAETTVLEECGAAYNRRDGFNYHSFVTSGTEGAYMNVYEYNCFAKESGYDGFANQPAITDSNNASTAHDMINIERVNTVGKNTYGSVIADVGGSVSENWNVTSLNPTHGTTSVPKTCYWSEASSMYLHGCRGINFDVAGDVLTATSSGKIYIDAWRGDVSAIFSGDLLSLYGFVV